MDGWSDEWMVGWSNGQMDGWVDGGIDGQRGALVDAAAFRGAL